MNNNQWTTEQIIKDLDLLSREGVVGFYSRCEITEIFLFKKKGQKEQQTLNLLTLVVFEEASILAKSEYLTPKGGIKIQIKDISHDRCGIQRYYVSPEELKNYFKVFIMESNSWNPSGKPDEILKTSKLTFLPKQYVPADSTYSVALNSILKNNFHCGSYLLEGFDEDKKDKDVDLLLRDTVALDSLSESIRKCIPKCIPISIAKLTDRLGNIILQFPITILSSKFSVKQQTGVHVEIVWHPKLKNEPPPCEVITLTELDGTFLGFGQLEKPNPENFDVPSGNSSSIGIKNILFDKKNQLILAFQIISSVQKSHSGRKCGESKPRVFTIPGETHTQEIEFIRQYHEVKYPGRFDWIENRLVEDGRKQLEDCLSFVQYGKNERGKALKDIRKLITRHGEEGVYLWDPYLDATDILCTLYFCKHYNAPLRAIASFNKKIKNHLKEKGLIPKSGDYEDYDVNKWKADQEKTLKENSGDSFGLNLVFRVQYGIDKKKQYGWKFHDRFLIFPCTRTKVKAWSLGASVNSLGESHHILHEVSNAQHVLDAFNELWEQLKDSSCKVWEYKQ